MGEGIAEALSPDGKWVVTKPAKGGALSLVPTGAGEARQLTHDNISYGDVHYLPDGRQLLASGIEADHGQRDYLIDLKSGNAKPITPEGTAGTLLSPDGRSIAVTGPDGKWGVWPLDGRGLRPIPGLDSKYGVTAWTPDGSSVYTIANQQSGTSAKVYRVHAATGKMEYWKTLGADLPAGVDSVYGPFLSGDGKSYVYLYSQVLSEAYVVKGLK
jgi:hypothetical protein